MNQPGHLDPQIMQEAFAARDRRFDGCFVAGVTSTGIYCRPSCPARRPRPEHVRFLTDAVQARAAGFRPCLRCQPDSAARDRAAVAKALALLEEACGPMPLLVLADHCGYSPAHLQRLFTRACGLSPAAFGRRLRVEQARAAIRAESSVTAAIYAAGYSGPSRFYADMNGELGMTARAWKEGGAGELIDWAVAETSFGPLLVAATQVGVCRVAFGEGRAELAQHFPRAQLREGAPDFALLLARVVAAVERPGSDVAIPLDLHGTAFRQRVWAALRKIPSGETRNYGEIAAELGQPGAARAVGQANGANPVAVLVPCHRVIAADGSPGGYNWGLAVKAELLRREQGAG